MTKLPVTGSELLLNLYERSCLCSTSSVGSGGTPGRFEYATFRIVRSFSVPKSLTVTLKLNVIVSPFLRPSTFHCNLSSVFDITAVALPPVYVWLPSTKTVPSGTVSVATRLWTLVSPVLMSVKLYVITSPPVTYVPDAGVESLWNSYESFCKCSTGLVGVGSGSFGRVT